MPLNPRASVGKNIEEFRTGKTFAHTEDKYGKADAERQAVAVALHTKDKAGDPPKKDPPRSPHMAHLSADTRKRMPDSDFAGPDHSFPIEDKKHARLAISGATRSEHAGNISPSEEAHIKTEARHELGQDGHAEDHKTAVAKMHPEHVHKLVKAAHEGKFGPEAQKMAQSAQQPGPGSDVNGAQPGEQEQPQPGRTLAAKHIFGRKPGIPEKSGPYNSSVNDQDEDDEEYGSSQPANARSIFGR